MYGTRRVIIGMVVASLVTTIAFASGAGARTRSAAPSAAQGVTKDQIEIAVLVNDIDGLRSKGIQLPTKLTTQNTVDRWQAYVDAYGPINGRTVKITPVTWDVTDATSYDRACTEATQDVKPFVVLNNGGWRSQLVPCVTVDNQTPLFIKDSVYGELFEASGNRLFTLLPPSDMIGSSLADLVAKEKLVPKSAKIGILASNDPGAAAATDALEAGLKKRGYDVVTRIDINSLSGQTAVLNRETAAAVSTFTSQGVDTVFNGVQSSQSLGFYEEAARSNAGLKVFLLDDAPANCNNTSARLLPASAVGIPCLTSSGTNVKADLSGVKPDTKMEAACRRAFDKAFNEKTQPGAPAGDITINGVTYTEDFDSDGCSMIDLLLPAIEKAGKNPTWDKVAKNLESTKSAPAALMSNGRVSFGKNKRYAADMVHLVKLNGATPASVKGANGLYDGCPIPSNCWVPQPVDGEEWFPLTVAQQGKSG